MESKYKIEKEIPHPKNKGNWQRFPFEVMEVGDSFLVTKEDEKARTLIQLKSILWRKSNEYKMDTGDVSKFTFNLYRSQDGVRCFKIE